MNPKLSIITVCKNAHADLLRTAGSVFHQTEDDFEWIIVDGASTDGTVDFLEGMEDSRVRFLSEPDAGIYDAMNKGLRIARGEWVWFLNAGDRACDESVLRRILFNEDADICFGDTSVESASGAVFGLRSQVTPHQLPPALHRSFFRRGMVVSHQAFIVKRMLCSEYDLRYTLSSDLDWMLRILSQTCRSKNIGCIAVVMREGATMTNWKRSQWERFRILCRHFGCVDSLWQHVRILLRRIVHVLRGGLVR